MHCQVLSLTVIMLTVVSVRADSVLIERVHNLSRLVCATQGVPCKHPDRSAPEPPHPFGRFEIDPAGQDEAPERELDDPFMQRDRESLEEQEGMEDPFVAAWLRVYREDADAAECGYCMSRDQLVSEISRDELMILVRLRDDPSTDWKMSAQSGILIERAERGPEFQAMIEMDWMSDPDYRTEWAWSLDGPLLEARGLIQERYRSVGLWYHYFEHIWKDMATAGTGLPRFRFGRGDFDAFFALNVFRQIEQPAQTSHGPYFYFPDRHRYVCPEEFIPLLTSWALESIREVEDYQTARSRQIISVLESFNTLATRKARLRMLARDRRITDAFRRVQFIGVVLDAVDPREAAMYEDFAWEFLPSYWRKVPEQWREVAAALDQAGRDASAAGDEEWRRIRESLDPSSFDLVLSAVSLLRDREEIESLLWVLSRKEHPGTLRKAIGDPARALTGGRFLPR